MLTKFDLTLSPNPADCRITVNDEPVTDAMHVWVEAGVGEVPKVTMQRIAGAARLEGVGVVQELVPTANADVIVAFLDDVDPEVLEKRTLATADLAEPVAIGMLRVLKEMARGDHDGT